MDRLGLWQSRWAPEARGLPNCEVIVASGGAVMRISLVPHASGGVAPPGGSHGRRWEQSAIGTSPSHELSSQGSVPGRRGLYAAAHSVSRSVCGPNGCTSPLSGGPETGGSAAQVCAATGDAPALVARRFRSRPMLFEVGRRLFPAAMRFGASVRLRPRVERLMN